MAAALWWWQKGESEELFLERIKRLKEQLGSHARLTEFASSSATGAAAIAADLRAEGTQPLCSNLEAEVQAAVKQCEEFVTEDAVEEWQADGSSVTEAARRQQLLQHARAWRYVWELPSDEPLTLQSVKKAHSILMCGAVAAIGATNFNGRFRLEGAYAASNGPEPTVFAPADTIEPRLEVVLSRLDANSLGSIACFFERFLYVHPFKDGNGRLARLLVSRSLKLHGLPIPTSIASLPRKANKNLLGLIERSREGRDKEHSLLRLYLVEVIYTSWRNFASYVAYDSADALPPAAKRIQRL